MSRVICLCKSPESAPKCSSLHCRHQHTMLSSAQDTTFAPLKNTYGAVWEASNLPAFPLDLRLTDALGHAVVAA